MPKSQSTDEVKAGLLVVSCAAVLVLLLFLVGSPQLFGGTKTYHLMFGYISGLTKNAPVHFAGHEVGKVTGIDFVAAQEPRVRVTINIDEDIMLREDTEAFINVMGFMGETYIELSPGTSEGGTLQPKAEITGTDPVPMMEIVKRGTALLDEFEQTSDSLVKLVSSLSGMLEENEEEINSIVGNIDAATGNLKDMTADLKAHPWKLLKKGDAE